MLHFFIGISILSGVVYLIINSICHYELNNLDRELQRYNHKLMQKHDAILFAFGIGLTDEEVESFAFFNSELQKLAAKLDLL